MITQTFLRLLCLFAALSPSAFLLAQGGSLTPPGAPAVTMKSLSEIDPGTPINPADVPVTGITLSTPGNYYLTGNLTGIVSFAAISINSSNVHIDLRGFHIDAAISAFASHRNLSVKNGTLEGVAFSGNAGTRCESLQIYQPGLHGIQSGDGAVIVGCQVDGSATPGFGGAAGILVGSNSLIKDCIIQRCDGEGIEVGLDCRIAGCTLYNNGEDGIQGPGRCMITDTVCALNSFAGVNMFSNDRWGTVATRVVTYLNGGNGLRVDRSSSVLQCASYMNGATGISTATGSSISQSTAYMNGSLGITTGATAVVENCTAYDNVGDGITAGSYSVVRGCAAYVNDESGFGAGSSIAFDTVRYIGCNASNNAHNGFEGDNEIGFSNCNAWNNGQNGFLADEGAIVDSCIAYSNSGGGIVALNSATIRSCVTRFNTSHGISTAQGASISECSAYDNNGAGILTTNASVVSKCSAILNSLDGFTATDGCTFSLCAAFDNTIEGFNLADSNRVVDCIAKDNNDSGFSGGDRNYFSGCIAENNGNGSTDDGFEIVQFNTIRHCAAMGNTGDGIRATGANNFIERNHCRANSGQGIDLLGSGSNVVFLNYVSGNTGGSITPNPGAAGFGDIAPISTTMAGLTHPLSNFD